jgi:hypothetical protein
MAVPPELPRAAFVEYTGERRLSRLSAQTFVAAATDLPKISILTFCGEASALRLHRQQQQLLLHEGYPNLEWHLSAPSQALQSLPSSPALVHHGLEHDPGTSPGVALAALLRQADGPYVLLLGPGCLPQLFCLFQMMLRLHHHPTVAAVGGRQVDAAGNLVQAGMLLQDGQVFPVDLAQQARLGDGFSESVRQVAAVSGACLLMRSELLRALPLAQLPALSQPALGVEICRLLHQRRGGRVLIAPAAVWESSEPASEPDGCPRSAASWEGVEAPTLRAAQENAGAGVVQMDLSVVSCTNDYVQFASHVFGSLLNNTTRRQCEVVPVLNVNNPHSAASALNLGIQQASADFVVLCHQDVVFYKAWVEILFARIAQLGSRPWAILGTAGIRLDGVTTGVVHRLCGAYEWYTRCALPLIDVQTVDEHCMVYQRSSGICFDETTCDGFHFYGPDICLEAASKNFAVVGIYNPLVHNGGGGSLRAGEGEYTRLMRQLSEKWRATVPRICTPTGTLQGVELMSTLRF